jgi:hypothetical protein
MCEPGKPCYTEQDTLRAEWALVKSLDPVKLEGDLLTAIVNAQHRYDDSRVAIMKDMEQAREKRDIEAALRIQLRAKVGRDEYLNAIQTALQPTALSGLTFGDFTIDLTYAEAFGVGFAHRLPPKDEEEDMGAKLAEIIGKALNEAAGELGIGNIKVEEVRL